MMEWDADGKMRIDWHVGTVFYDKPRRSAFTVPGDFITDLKDPLHSQSEPTIKDADPMKPEEQDMIDLSQQLVELSDKVARFNGRYDAICSNAAHAVCPVFTETLAPVGEEGFVVGEKLKPAGVHLTKSGTLLVLMRTAVPEPTDHYLYAGFNIGQLEDSFPDVYDTIDGQLDGEPVAGWVGGVHDRLRNKPALINLVRDYLHQGRKQIKAGLAQQEVNAEADFNNTVPDFGIF
jgi:hypothetical protein